MFPGLADYADLASVGHIGVSFPTTIGLEKCFRCLGPQVQEVKKFLVMRNIS